MNKSELRNAMIKRRSGLSAEYVKSAGEKVLRNLVDGGFFNDAKLVFIYVDMKNEMPTRSIINYCFEKGIRVCVPKVVALTESSGESRRKVMKSYLIDNLDKDLAKGTFGVMEPVFIGAEADRREIFLRDIDIVFLPGSVFDAKGNRIGYGAGYYDSYLAEHEKCKAEKIALCYEFQVVESIFPEKHDIPVDFIATENGIIECGNK